MLAMEENIRPPITPAQARAALQENYGIAATEIRELPSELDRNYRLRAATGEAFVLKIAHPSVSDSALDLQNQTLRHLRQSLDIVPELIEASGGAEVIGIQGADGGAYRARLLRYIEGAPLCDFRPHSEDLLADIGGRLGTLSAALQGFEHSEKRLSYRWHIGNLTRLAPYGEDLPREKKALLDHFVELYKKETLPALPRLRHSHTYNDPNDTNILVRATGAERPRVLGMIDFGDMVYGPLIADLAVALAYVMLDAERPLDKAAPLVRAYHRAFPLREDEIALLYPLVAARLCLSVCISWHQQKREPDNRRLSISEDRAWALLERLRAIHPRFARYHFRAACGLPPCPDAAKLTEWLRGQSFAPILGFPLSEENSKLVDLGLQSRLLAQVDDLADPAAYAEPLRRLLRGKIGIGYYNEVRPIYLTEMFALDHHERRTAHLGVDLFAAPDTPIHAPLAGIVHSVAEYAAAQDYGPVLIIRHQAGADVCFYTLYGHIAPDALARWQAGQKVAAGDLIARIGETPRNGNWTPHLHFQIITDMLGFGDTFPGVCSPRWRDLWTALSPNPNLILRRPFSLEPAQPAQPSDLLARRRAALNPALSLSYQSPLTILRGSMARLYDQAGQPYLDCVNNVAHVGHGHPRVLRAGREQMALLNTNTRYLHETILEYAEALRATLPEPLSVCFFVNSGSEANELALRLARACTDGSDVVVIDHAYHGHTSALIDISPYKFNGRGRAGQPAHVHVAAMPDGFRGAARGFGEEAGEFYARSFAEQVNRARTGGRQLAAFFAEGIMGCGGQMPLPAGYLKRAYARTRAAGGLCVADEVQTGFGRVGSHFWAFERSGVVPDIVTMGKPMGNGHPLGAVVTRPEIAAAFDNGMEYFNTFGGNPVSCAIGLEVLRVIADEGLRERARDVGAYWLEGLRELGRRFPIIGQARGAGLFLGVELVRDRETLAPAAWETAYVVERMKSRGILLSTEGPRRNVLKLKPPLCIGRGDVELFLEILAEALGDNVLDMG